MLNVAVLFFARPGYFFLPYGYGVSPFGGVWDACAARGKAGPVMGLRPLLGPPCIPPEAPPKKRFQFPSDHEGNASPAAGASFPRSARSGDLPSRRVNARRCFRFECESASAQYLWNICGLMGVLCDLALTLMHIAARIIGDYSVKIRFP